MIQQLSDLAELIMGQSPPSSSYNNVGEGLPFFQGKSEFGFRHPLPRKYCNEPIKIAEGGDILMSVRAPVGPVNICNTQSCIGRGLAAIRPKKVNEYFLYYCLVNAEQDIASLGTGTTFQSINKSQLATLEFDVPPFPEQQIIAALLWKVQRAIELQQKIIDSTTEAKQVALEQLMTTGLRNEEQKETVIGLLPASWDVDEIDSKFKVTAGGTPSRTDKDYWEGGTIPWVKTGEVNYCIITDAEEKITEEGMTNSAAKLIPEGTLLIAMYGQGITRGKVAVLGIEATTNQACAALLPKKTNEIDTWFMYYYLAYSYERIRNLSHGAQQQNLSGGLIKSIKFPIPQKEEQEEIADILKLIDRKLEHHKCKKTLYKELFQSLSSQLMTGAIRVIGLDIDISDITS
jgi:type I restriction enzyme, S subunit